MEPGKIRRALISVYDKAGLIELARVLVDLSVELISTGGTSKVLRDTGLPVKDISEITEFPEILDGRVKTLHPRIHAGILAVRGNAEHSAVLKSQGIAPIDLVVCNLYPFEATRARAGSTHDEIVENIDIGGPSMIRAAAKNFQDVAVLTSPDQYPAILDELRTNGGILALSTRERLAAAAFRKTATYDDAIRHYFADRQGKEEMPKVLDLHYERRSTLRYGENPHQKAAFYIEPNCNFATVANADLLHGKELSFNNLLDLDSALNLVREFQQSAAVVIKHNNPCGAAIGATLAEAFHKAYEGDPQSAYGGVLGFNQQVDAATAQSITEPKRFIECIIAPGYSDEAFELLITRPTWKKSVRILRTGSLEQSDARSRSPDFRRIDGGLLVQTRDLTGDEMAQVRVVTKQTPTAAQWTDLRFAWYVCKHVKSNAIVLAKEGMIVGVGAGQMSRVDSVQIAVRKAGDRVKGSVLASDAFFPFRDNIDDAARAGVVAMIQPGGSMRDQDSIQACDDHGLAMAFTGVRHFRH